MKYRQIVLFLAVPFLNITSNFLVGAEQVNNEQSLKNHDSELENDRKDLGYCCVRINNNKYNYYSMIEVFQNYLFLIKYKYII